MSERDWRRFVRALPPWICVELHVLGVAALLAVLRHGMESEPDLEARARYVAENVLPWRISIAVWMATALSIVGFYVWWGARLAPGFLRIAGPVVAAAGMGCDLFGESLWIGELVASAQAGALGRFEEIQSFGTLLTGGAANGLYTLGGILLTLGTRNLPPWVRGAMWLTWTAGVAMTVSVVVASVPGLMISTAVLFPVLIVWIAWMGLRWSGGSS